MVKFYNTGKIKIGEFYEPPRRIVDMGKHAELLQMALLGIKPTLLDRIRMWTRCAL